MEPPDYTQIFQDMMDEAGIPASTTRIEKLEFIRYFLLNTDSPIGRWVSSGRIEVEAWSTTQTGAKSLLNRVRRYIELNRPPGIKAIYVDEGMRESPTGEDGYHRYSYRIRIESRNREIF